jgi:protein SCO1/2
MHPLRSQLNALVTGLKGMDLLPGKDFTLATVSIDHRNNSELAASKRTAYLNSLARPNADWKFLTGEQEQIVKLAGSVGFEYKYDPETDQFAHNAAVFFISPKGVVSRYLYGIQYNPRDIKFSLMEASEGKLGSVKDKLLLNCFHYDELTGKYTSMVLKIMRMAGIVTATGLALWLGFLWRREAIRKASDLKLELLKSNRKESFVS